MMPDPIWLSFAPARFPIYLSPQLLKPLVRGLRVRRAARGLIRPAQAATAMAIFRP